MPKKLDWKQTRRARPVYDRTHPTVTRPDGATIYRTGSGTTRGSKPCACGRTISANKEKCAGCAGVAK